MKATVAKAAPSPDYKNAFVNLQDRLSDLMLSGININALARIGKRLAYWPTEETSVSDTLGEFGAICAAIEQPSRELTDRLDRMSSGMLQTEEHSYDNDHL